MTNACPSTRTIDSGDYAEALECDLPIEHNVDGSWHEAGWASDDETMSLHWAPEIGERCFWPPVRSIDPLSLAQSRFYADKMITTILGESTLATGIPTEATIPPEGTQVKWRKWPKVPATT